MLSRVARPLRRAASLLAWIAIPTAAACAAQPAPSLLKIGMIGLDTSHCLEFTKLINADPPGHAAMYGSWQPVADKQ